MSETSARPAWFARREIAPFTLDDEAVQDILGRATHGVVSWVTKECKPVSAVMLFCMIDGKITMSSTTNRAKYHAWRRNPAACFCTWDPESIGRQVTLRGEMELMQDPELLRKFTEVFLTRRAGGEAPTPDRLQEEYEKFDAPDRHMMQLKVDKVLTHDLHKLFQVETEGTDVWG